MRSMYFHVLMLFVYSIANASSVSKGNKTYSSDTFKPFKATTTIKSRDVVWDARLDHQEQETYRVSLVGVNINTWLENPNYFQTLQEQARRFSMTKLLNNLQAFNPTLVFNRPEVVKSALAKDIYTPYLKVITNSKKKLLQFSDISNVVSYTRDYHIYGTTAGHLPYFGQPMEGSKRLINLGILGGQLQEIAVKLPDTDIFLVAMINVVPNWLQEGWDIHQISQQELEILVYAFDRRGKVIGGAGIPSDVYHDRTSYVVEQKIRSQIWQEGTARQFYLWPSSRLLNDRKTNSVAKPLAVSLPTSERPRLNKQQRYILTALRFLTDQQQSTNTNLFTPSGKQIVKVSKIRETQKVVLIDRVLRHTNSILLRNTKKTTTQASLLTIPLTAKLSEITEFDKKKEETKLTKYYPSNEGEKLESLFAYTQDIIAKPIFTRTNELFYTNTIAPYELEVDPVIYQREQKKYAILPYNVSAYKKRFRKNTKDLVRQNKLQLEDKIYWNNYRMLLLKNKGLRTVEIENAYANWLELYKQYVIASTEQLKIERKIELYIKLMSVFSILKERNIDLMNNRYIDDQKKRTKALVKIEKISLKLSIEIKEEFDKLKAEVDQQKVREKVNSLAKEEKQKYMLLSSLIPKEFEKEIKIKITNQYQCAGKLYELADYSQVDLDLITYGLENGKKSPLIKEKQHLDLKEEKLLNKKLQYLPYEGFMLGITSAWSTRTKLIDRLDYL